MQKVRNNGKSVLVKGFYALILERNVLIIGRAYKRPVRSALVKDDTEELVFRCADIKRAVVEKDEFELKKRSGRKLLNLGHTIGHALEASKGFTLSHGLCVAYGIMKIIDLSADFYSLSPEVVSQMKGLLNAYAFNFDSGVDMRDVKSRILFDNKVSGDKISMILLKDIGEPKVENIRISDMWRILK